MAAIVTPNPAVRRKLAAQRLEGTRKKVKKRKSGAIQFHYLSIFKIRNNAGSSSLDVDGVGGGEPASCTVIVTHCADEAHKDRVAH